MRLGQLARKIAVKPSELVDFLSSKGIPTESGINTRLESDQVRFIVMALAPEKLDGIMAEPVVAEEPEVVVTQPENVVEKVTVLVEPEPIVMMDEVPVPAPSVHEEVRKEVITKEEIEIIKAPKVELQGLKVLGKIELPDLKKKEPVIDATGVVSESSTNEGTPVKNTPPSVKRNPPHQRREQRIERSDRPAKNPIALKREQEALEAERKRKERAELEKEKRTQNYMKRVKSAPTKAVKHVEEEQVIEVIEDEVKPPKTWIGKFFRWFKS